MQNLSLSSHLRDGLKPLLAKTLENALAHRIAKEFPRIGGPRICKLCAEMIMEVVTRQSQVLAALLGAKGMRYSLAMSY